MTYEGKGDHELTWAEVIWVLASALQRLQMLAKYWFQ